MKKLPEITTHPWTKEKRDAIIDAVSNRIPLYLAAESNGVGVEIFKDWIYTAQIDMDGGLDNEFTQFYTAIKKAQMTKIREHLSIIAARPENWEADAWILQHCWPNDYINSGESHGKGKEKNG